MSCCIIWNYNTLRPYDIKLKICVSSEQILGSWPYNRQSRFEDVCHNFSRC